MCQVRHTTTTHLTLKFLTDGKGLQTTTSVHFSNESQTLQNNQS